jgi:leucyl/phenylalanyl-tRNA--protein transferase
MPLFQLDPQLIDFPPVELALNQPQGLLAVGGDLSRPRLLNAYQQGIFPWYSEGEPIYWWCPSPRMVMKPEQLHISRSLAKILRRGLFQVTIDQAFTKVINQCAHIARSDTSDTWITSDMQTAYIDLFKAGYAHSVEVWYQGNLCGGLYGIALGQIFFGESMFSCMSNASKVAFVYLVKQLQDWDFMLLDCQMHTDHLTSLGAGLISLEHFQQYLQVNQQWGLDSAWSKQFFFNHSSR